MGNVAGHASVSLGWQQLLGLEPFPKVAGAMGQLVQVDLESAEAAFLILLTRSGLRRPWVPLHVRELCARSIPTW